MPNPLDSSSALPREVGVRVAKLTQDVAAQQGQAMTDLIKDTQPSSNRSVSPAPASGETGQKLDARG